MRLKIEDWIEQNSLPYESKELMQEAILCYKAGAHRASLLFSYLAFQTTLKERILTADKPEAIPAGKWGDITKRLEDEDKWDPTVYETINTKQPAQIFPISEDLRNQVTYWKDRRNDCAHAKRNLISSSHVDAFWYFLQSNLGKFYIVGGIGALIEKIKNHFDKSMTPPSSDFTHLIHDFSLVVTPSDLQAVLQDLHEIFKPRFTLVTEDKDILNFWFSLFNLPENLRAIYVQDLIQKQEVLCIELLRQDPDKIEHFRDHPTFIRKLWHDKFNSYRDFKLFMGLLRKQVIPEPQIPEAIEYFISRQTQITFNDLPDAGDFTLLRDVGFFEKFKEYAFVKNGINSFEWANSRKEFVVYYIKTFGLDEEIVRALNHTFGFGDHPWHLRDSLIEMFKDNEGLTEQYKSICESLDDRPVKRLGF